MIAIEFSHGSSSFDLNVCTPGNKLPISRHGHSTSDYIMALLNVAAVRGISLMPVFGWLLGWCPAGCSGLVLHSRRRRQQQPSSRSRQQPNRVLVACFEFCAQVVVLGLFCFFCIVARAQYIPITLNGM